MFTRCHKSFWQSELCKAIQSSLRKESTRCDYTTVILFKQQAICVYAMECCLFFCFVVFFFFFFWGGGGGCPQYFFWIHFNELLKRIQRAGIGYHIGHHFDGGVWAMRTMWSSLALPYVDCSYWLIQTKNSLLSTTLQLTQEKTVCTYFGSRNIIACRQVSLNSV